MERNRARPNALPSNYWLIGAALGGYLLIAFVFRFWGEGLLLPASDLAYVNSPPPESHLGQIVLVLVGVFVVLLAVLQSVFFIQGSKTLTRFSLWLNFLAIFFYGVALFGPRDFVIPLFLVLLVSVLAFPVGLVLSVVNVLWGWLRRDRLPNVEPHS